MSKTFLREGCSVEVEVGRKCLTTERSSPDGALGGSRVAGGSHSWSVEGAEPSCTTMGEPCGRGGNLVVEGEEEIRWAREFWG